MLTDPAKELVDTLNLLIASRGMSFSERLKQKADVEPWSPGFFQIVFELLKRMDFLIEEVKQLPFDEELKEDTLQSIFQIKNVFISEHVLKLSCEQIGQTVSGSALTVLRMLSPYIRERVSYPVLSDEEIKAVIADVKQLLGWLEEQQSDDQEFLRQAMIEGLQSFVFRLERLEWLGRGYALEGLKDVLLAYLALEGAVALGGDGAELQKAILAKCSASIRRILKAFDVVRENTERADWALKAYGAVSAIADGSSTISGLLS